MSKYIHIHGCKDGNVQQGIIRLHSGVRFTSSARARASHVIAKVGLNHVQCRVTYARVWVSCIAVRLY